MRQRLLLLLLIALPILILDQGTKAAVLERFGGAPAAVEDGSARVLIDGVLSVHPTVNSELEDSTARLLPERLVRPLLLGAGVLALCFLVWLTLARKVLPLRAAMGVSALVGGAAGNLVDRMLRGHVLDWLQWSGPGAQSVNFTVGDVGIWSGVALLLVELVRPHDGPLAQPASPPALPGI